MFRILILFLSALALIVATAEGVTLDFAKIGNAGNAADPQTGLGAVAYNYAISTTEVTNNQYTAFLNAVDPTGANSLGLFKANMASNFGGIERNGPSNGARYVAKAGRGQNPVTFVSFFDAMRFTNWLHSGQGSGGTESGAYTIGNGLNEVRSDNAKYWIPSENEWYKAAYHDATAGTAGVYFDYATGSDTLPVSDKPADNSAAANYYNDDAFDDGFNDGYAVSGSISFPSSSNPLTDVGSYTAAPSPYGTFDQNGNVWEWNEAVISSSFRGLRGASWGFFSDILRPNSQYRSGPTFGTFEFGFRVATVVPEPSSVIMGVLTAAVGLLMRRRSK